MTIDPILPPPDLGFCRECHNYLKGAETEVYVITQGPDGRPAAIPVNAPGAEQIPIAMRRRERMAPCTWAPQWANTMAGGWCQQWKPRLSS